MMMHSTELTPQEIAAAVLLQVEKGEHYNQMVWYGSDSQEYVPANQPLACDTVACVAGHACHEAGYGLSAGNLAVKYGRGTLIKHKAAELLGLAAWEAEWLFDATRTLDEVTGALTNLAEGRRMDGRAR